jgi:hypothetical protein
MGFNKKFFTTGGIVASASAALDPLQNFETVTYTGNGSTQSISSLDFQPDLVWIKNRDGIYFHGIFDSIRGANKVISSNNSDIENQHGNWTQQLTSFDSNGFSLGDNSDSGNYVNVSGDDYVAWCWRAGGTVSANNNTDGDITSTVSANQDAGFSIVKYTKSGTTGTIAHGLDSAPEMILEKRTDGAAYWNVRVAGITNNNQTIYLNQSSGVGTHPSLNLWTTPTDSVFGYNSANATAGDYIAYCFHSVDGYQKVGSYTGDGTSSGNSIVTGFRPRFVLIKRTDSAGDWRIFDSVRNLSNPINNFLRPNESAAETTNSSTASIDFLSNGFEPNSGSASVNALDANYIYLAIA